MKNIPKTINALKEKKMWPFTNKKLLGELAAKDKRILELESKIKEKNGIISSLHDERKELLDTLHSIESHNNSLKKDLEIAEYDAASWKSDFEFLKDIEVTPEFLDVEKS